MITRGALRIDRGRKANDFAFSYPRSLNIANLFPAMFVDLEGACPLRVYWRGKKCRTNTPLPPMRGYAPQRPGHRIANISKIDIPRNVSTESSLIPQGCRVLSCLLLFCCTLSACELLEYNIYPGFHFVPPRAVTFRPFRAIIVSI